MENLNKTNRRARLKQYNPEVVVMPAAGGGWWRMFVIFGLIVLLVGGSVYLLFFSNYFKVQDVEITGDTKPEMVDGIKEMLKWETEYMALFNNDDFASSIKKRFDGLAKVEVSKKWPKTIKVAVAEEQPVLVWNSEGKLYLVDSTGAVMKQIEEKERLELYNNLSVIGDLSGLPVEENEKVVSRSFISFVAAIKQGIENSVKKEIEAFEVQETTFTLRIRMKEGYEVFFDTLRDPDGQIEKLNNFLKSQTLVNEYIDLRINGKVYYK